LIFEIIAPVSEKVAIVKNIIIEIVKGKRVLDFQIF